MNNYLSIYHHFHSVVLKSTARTKITNISFKYSVRQRMQDLYSTDGKVAGYKSIFLRVCYYFCVSQYKESIQTQQIIQVVKTTKVQATFSGGHGFSRMSLQGCGEAQHLCINWTSSAVIGEGVFLTSSRLKTSVPRVVSSDRRSLTGDKDKEKTEGKKNRGRREGVSHRNCE